MVNKDVYIRGRNASIIVNIGHCLQLLDCFADRTTTHTSRGNSSIDTSLIRDIYCGPEVLFETCVAMKLVDDDDDDDKAKKPSLRVSLIQSLNTDCICHLVTFFLDSDSF